MSKGWAINLAGGYAHAQKHTGAGFCIYPDTQFMVHFVRKIYGIRKVMVVDLDAHQGNGYERDFIGDPDTYIIDFYNHTEFPLDQYAKQAIRKDVWVTDFDNETYLKRVDEVLKESIAEFLPEFVIYNAGSDIIEGDPLGRLKMTPQCVLDRDEMVFDYCVNKHRIPIVMILSGGLMKPNAELIADSIGNVMSKFDLKNLKDAKRN